MSAPRFVVPHLRGRVEVYRHPQTGEIHVDADFKLGVVIENGGKHLILTPEAPEQGVSWEQGAGPLCVKPGGPQ